MLNCNRGMLKKRNVLFFIMFTLLFTNTFFNVIMSFYIIWRSSLITSDAGNETQLCEWGCVLMNMKCLVAPEVPTSCSRGALNSYYGM